MAIIVNKEEKRRNIALSCRELLLEHGINSLTISQIAKTAGVGKGTIYEYFENKEDIVFEIITTFIVEHERRLLELSDAQISTKEKLFQFFYLLFEDELVRKQLKVYKEFLAISLSNEPEEMLLFSQQCHDRFTVILSQILEAGRDSGEIAEKKLVHESTLILFATGLIVDSRLFDFDVETEIHKFLEMLLSSNEKEL